MFHDQGHIPVKSPAFKVDPSTGKWRSISDVNVTVYLPNLRTPVDHGSAIDIAGQGIANAVGLIDAGEYAAKPIEGRRRKDL
jgi:4-hydroxythreonine-4-phosphate dehydrogenase